MDGWMNGCSHVRSLQWFHLTFFDSPRCRQQVEPVAQPGGVHATSGPSAGGLVGLPLGSDLLLFPAHRHLCFLQQSLHFTGTSDGSYVNDAPLKYLFICISLFASLCEEIKRLNLLMFFCFSLHTWQMILCVLVLPVVSVPPASGHPPPAPVTQTGGLAAAALVCWTGNFLYNILCG